MASSKKTLAFGADSDHDLDPGIVLTDFFAIGEWGS